MIESRTTAARSVNTSRSSGGLPEATHSVWHVFTEIGTQVMTLGALEAALLRGDVSLSTLVWIPGLVEWEPLGKVANLRSASLVPSAPRLPVGVAAAAHQGGEAAHPGGERARSTERAQASAAAKAGVAPLPKPAQAWATSAPRARGAVRRWRRAAAVMAVLVLILLCGSRLADALAHQHQRVTAPAPTPPSEPTRW